MKPIPRLLLSMWLLLLGPDSAPSWVAAMVPCFFSPKSQYLASSLISAAVYPNRSVFIQLQVSVMTSHNVCFLAVCYLCHLLVQAPLLGLWKLTHNQISHVQRRQTWNVLVCHSSCCPDFIPVSNHLTHLQLLAKVRQPWVPDIAQEQQLRRRKACLVPCVFVGCKCCVKAEPLCLRPFSSPFKMPTPRSAPPKLVGQ